MKIEQIIFDFDGVILASHKIKDTVFYELFLPYGKKIAKAALNYHKKNIGKSRFIKFNFIIKNLLNEDTTQAKLNLLSKNFNELTLKKIDNLKISKHLINFFKKEKKSYDFYISTGTPQNIINQILMNKKITKYFKKVYGSPMNKVQHIKLIKKNKKKTLFIGDSIEDYISCKKTGTKFILKEHNENKNKFLKKKILKIKNFNNFKKFLENFN